MLKLFSMFWKLLIIFQLEVLMANARPKPLVYWTVMKGGQVRGAATQTTTSEMATSMVKEFVKSTMSNNRAAVSSTVSVEALAGAFSASVSAEFEHFNEAVQSSSSVEGQSMAKAVQTSVEVPKGEWYLAIAEMHMYVFLTKDGKKQSLVVPTGNIISGAMGKDGLEPHLLDETFYSVAKEYGLKIYSRDELQELVEPSDLPTIEITKAAGFPKENVFYQLVNSNYPEIRIGAWTSAPADIGCGHWAKGYNSQDQFWRFEKIQDGAYFVIFNKVRVPYRLQDADATDYIRQVGGRINDDQKFVVESLGNNRVRITSKAGNHLVQWGPWYDNKEIKRQKGWENRICGFRAKVPSPGDDIWILRPEQ